MDDRSADIVVQDRIYCPICDISIEVELTYEPGYPGTLYEPGVPPAWVGPDPADVQCHQCGPGQLGVEEVRRLVQRLEGQLMEEARA